MHTESLDRWHVLHQVNVVQAQCGVARGKAIDGEMNTHINRVGMQRLSAGGEEGV